MLRACAQRTLGPRPAAQKAQGNLGGPSTGHCLPRRRRLCPPHPAATCHIEPCCTARPHVQRAVPCFGSISSVQITGHLRRGVKLPYSDACSQNSHYFPAFKTYVLLLWNKFAESSPLFFICYTDSLCNQSPLV